MSTANKTEITNEQILEIFEATGAIGLTADVLGMSRQAVWYRQKTCPKLKAAIEESKKHHIDIAEDQLHINIMAGKETSLIYYLNCQARHKGYGNFRAEDKREEAAPVPLDDKFL